MGMGAVRTLWKPVWRRISSGSQRGRTKHLAPLTLALALALALIVPLLAACGVSTGPGDISSGTPTVSPTVSPSASATSVASTPTMSTQPPTSAVTLSADQTAYSPSSTIIVKLTNNRSTSIFTFDHQTSCTILTLQRQTSSGWQNVGGCALGRATQRVEIKAGETMTITLAPSAGQIRATPWPTGTCRAALHYVLPGQNAGAAGTTVTTATFAIR